MQETVLSHLNRKQTAGRNANRKQTAVNNVSRKQTAMRLYVLRRIIIIRKPRPGGHDFIQISSDLLAVKTKAANGYAVCIFRSKAGHISVEIIQSGKNNSGAPLPEPHAHKSENHAFDFSWSSWLAAWFAGPCALYTYDVRST